VDGPPAYRSYNAEYLSRLNKIVALTSPSRATVAFDGDTLHWPRLCSPLSTITLASAVTNISV
jgi:hypothetical protein